MYKAVLGAICCLSFALSLHAQSPQEKGLQSISRTSAEAIVGFLADDELQGREAGMHGSRLAARYLASCLKEAGIAPLEKDNYYQPFEAYNKERQQRGRWQVHPDSITILEQGTHRILQIARAFLATGQKPLRTVIFAFWDGEEKGLLGSKYFVQSCPFISQVKGYLNFDMIGRNNKPEQPQHVVYFYTAAHPVFGDWLKQDIARYSLRLQPDYRAWDRPTGGSDNASFALCNIPIIWYHTDGHPDYHQPSDHTDWLNWEKMIEITKAAFLNAWNLANENKY